MHVPRRAAPVGVGVPLAPPGDHWGCPVRAVRTSAQTCWAWRSAVINRCCSEGGTDPGSGWRPSDRRRQFLPGFPRSDLRHHNRLLCTGIGHPIILTAPGGARSW